MTIPKLSVLVPCYNECGTLAPIVERILSVELPGLELELVLVDDASDDGSAEVGQALMASFPGMKYIRHPHNQGKGAAIRTAIAGSSGNILLIQDADLEYDPGEYSRLIAPILDERADVVYGSRFRGGESQRVLYYWHSVGNKFLTTLSNMFTNLNLTDMEVCYKVFRREIVQQLTLRENRFGFEPEVTAKLARMNPRPRIFEVGIAYAGRTYEEGKKISWKDGVRAVYCILRYNLFD